LTGGTHTQGICSTTHPIVVVVTSFADNHPHLGLGPLTRHPTSSCSQKEKGTLQPPPTGQHNSKPHGTIPTRCQHLPRGAKAPLTTFNMPRRGFPFFHRSQPTIYQPLFHSRNCVVFQVCLPFPTSLAVLTATHCMDTLHRLPSLRVLKNCWNGEFLVGRRSRLDTY
jgi:hypothetical protein